jgi:hypothetical protein
MANPKRILLVDDDDILRYAFRKILLAEGFCVDDAGDFVGTLEVLEDHKPLHCMVTDLMLPKVHGFALARMARLRRPGLKVIHVTGQDVPVTEAMGPVLRKPVDPDTLIAEIRALI